MPLNCSASANPLRRGVPPDRFLEPSSCPLRIHLERPGVIALFPQDLAQVAVGLGVVGLEPDRRAVFGDGLVELPLVSQGDAEVVVGLGEVGLEPDRRAVFGDRLVAAFPWAPARATSPRSCTWALGVSRA